ncbi:MAG: M1 family peptidase [Candidatus Zixiibacteriota bacterium]|nr:MAG: M1 family peptidase [candidate division Zixibacteria bacterium]
MNHRTFIPALLGLLALAFTAAAGTDPVPRFPYQILRHDLAVDLDLERQFITASDRITLRPDGARPGEGLELLLRRGLEVTAVLYDGEKTRFTTGPADLSHFEAEADSEDVVFYARAQALRLELPSGAAGRDSFTVQVEYRGEIRDSLEGADFSREYVAMEVTGIVSGQGVYLGPEGIFYPALPQQLFTFSLSATVPEDWRTVSEGKDGEAQVKDGRRTETWTSRQPVDGFHLIAGRFEVKEVDHEGISVRTYFFPDTTGLDQRYLAATKDYLSLYNELLGPYPFEKFAVVENFFATGYGMPSFTLLGSEVLRLPFIIGISLGHEICHNWWGNSVYLDYVSGNWCEGLTTYCADYLYKERRSPAEAAEYRQGLLRDYLAYTHEHNDFPLTEFVMRHNPAQRAVGYGKSAMVYHMLRHRVGEEAFWRSLQWFYRDYQYKFATWGDLQRVFEAESGQPLGDLFHQWVQRAGAPHLVMQGPMLTRLPEAWRVSFPLAQDQPGEPYNLSLPVKISGADRDTVVHVPVNQAAVQVDVTVPFEPLRLAVDPDFDLFRRLDPAEIAPSLAETFGARDLVIVLPDQAVPELRAAYEELAAQFNRRGEYRIVGSSELTPEARDAGAVFFLGRPPENPAIPASWLPGQPWEMAPGAYRLLGGEYRDPNAALLAVMRHPADPGKTAAFFAGESPEAVREAGRKLTHYGKYSYLLFFGGKNQLKGSWEVSGGPLTYNFQNPNATR